MSDDKGKIGQTSSSADTIQEEQNKIRSGELSGTMEGLHAGTQMSHILKQLSELRKKKEEDNQKAILDLIDDAVNQFQNILDQIKEVDVALEATAKLKKLHEQGKLDLNNPIHLALFETAKFDPADYDPDGGITQFTKHEETLEEARQRLVKKANEIANSDDPDLMKDERFQSLRKEFEEMKEAHNTHDLDFNYDIVDEAALENRDNDYLFSKSKEAIYNVYKSSSTSSFDAAFKPELKGVAKQDFEVVASNFDFGSTETDHTLDKATVDEGNELETTEVTASGQKSTFDFG